MELDSAFEQKNEIAKAVEEELEKVFCFTIIIIFIIISFLKIKIELGYP